MVKGDNLLIIKDKIDRYCSHFTEKLQELSPIENPLFKKILLVTMLDALARAPFPKETSNKKRFVDFVDKFSDWQEKYRISLPQLSLLLESKPSTPLKNEVLKRLSFWDKTKEVLLSKDPECSDILYYASNEEINLIEKFKHSILLYAYRNELVHEFRKPGYGLEYSGDENPYHHTVNNKTTDLYIWETVYPVDFFMHIVKSALKALKEYLLRENINPYDSYRFGSIWNRK